jgi:hypothetical protein
MIDAKTMSLRGIAKELSVSHSSLSQVIHDKRPASQNLALALSEKGILILNGKQNTVSGKQITENGVTEANSESTNWYPQRNSNPC